MATFSGAVIGQTAAEIRTWTADFTDDLADGVTVTSGTATHYPPYGAAGTPTIAIASPNVQATMGTGLIAGQHYLDILATFSDGQKSSVKIAFWVDAYSTGMRATMVDIIADLRSLTDASPADYAVAGIPYWSDKQLQDILDKRRVDASFAPTQSMPVYASGTYTYNSFKLPMETIEGGTALTMRTANGVELGTALYSFDYARSVVTFTANMYGTPVYCDIRGYDLNGAAADVWRRKAAHYGIAYDVSTDNHNLSRSQLIKQCLQMVQIYEGLGGPQAVYQHRSDTDVTGW